MDTAALEEFFARLATVAGTAPVTGDEAEAVLDLARVVAHSLERPYAPVAAYALGLAQGAAAPADRVAAARRVCEAVAALDDD